MEQAQAVQRALLPDQLPTVAACDLAARWEPASAFGGDCYDAVTLDESHLALSIGDVCGKGLPAALLMSHFQASVRAFASPQASPEAVVTAVNRALCRHGDLHRFVTLFYSVYHVETRVLRFCNAGHNPPVLARQDSSIERLTAGGTMAGVFEEAVFEAGQVGLAGRPARALHRRRHRGRLSAMTRSSAMIGWCQPCTAQRLDAAGISPIACSPTSTLVPRAPRRRDGRSC